MKTYTIGRDPSCRIPINDIRISRQHAILRVYTFGKMEIVDLAKNGTWVNGVKLRPNIPFPVKRKDVVNLGNAVQLDWSYVPNPWKYVRLGIFAVLAIIALLLAICAISRLIGENSSITPTSDVGTVVEQPHSEGSAITTDTLKNGQEPVGQNEKASPSRKETKEKTLDGLFPQKKEKEVRKDTSKVKTDKPKGKKPSNEPKDDTKETSDENLEIL